MVEDATFTEQNENVTLDTEISLRETSTNVMMILSSTIASLGIISNLTVVTVFMRNKKLRIKIPNIFIINQVRKICHSKSSLIETSLVNYQQQSINPLFNMLSNICKKSSVSFHRVEHLEVIGSKPKFLNVYNL